MLSQQQGKVKQGPSPSPALQRGRAPGGRISFYSIDFRGNLAKNRRARYHYSRLISGSTVLAANDAETGTRKQPISTLREGAHR
jgi:hypothetical protein